MKGVRVHSAVLGDGVRVRPHSGIAAQTLTNPKWVEKPVCRQVGRPAHTLPFPSILIAFHAAAVAAAADVRPRSHRTAFGARL